MAVNITEREITGIPCLVTGGLLKKCKIVVVRANYQWKFIRPVDHVNSTKGPSAKPRQGNFTGQMTEFSN